MKLFNKPIFTGFAPNLTWQDARTACAFLFLPWQWRKIRLGRNVNKVGKRLKDFFNTEHAFIYDSGRYALHYALKALGAQEGAEVLVQAYTCIVVSNAITWTGATPVYVDIKNDFNMDAEDLKRKITEKSKILIIQHTFGKPADLDKLLAIAKEHNLKVIEDCAHSLGAKFKNKLTGTFGDIGMFSFGSDKVVSCARGGALITRDGKIAEKLKKFHSRLPKPDLIKTLQHLFHYPAFYKGKLFYNLGVGKGCLWLAAKLNLINKIIYNPEKHGKQVLFYPSLLANSLAKILLNQLRGLEKVNQHRQEIAKLYNDKINNPEVVKPEFDEQSIFLRYTLLVNNPNELDKRAKKQGIILGNWYNCAIAPCDIDSEATGYKKGSCPNAEKLSKMSINLPTNRHVTKKDALKVVGVVNGF